MGKNAALDEAIELIKQAARKLYYIGMLETVGCATALDEMLSDRLIPMQDKQENASE